MNTDAHYTCSTCWILNNKWVKNIKNSINENVQNTEALNNALDKISPSWVPTDPKYFPPCGENKLFDAPFGFDEFNSDLETKKKTII